MLYKVTKVESKSNDWKVIDVVNTQDNYPTTGVSVNRTNKKGEIFPNFDGIIEGYTLAGELWKSDGGKWYMFAPRLDTHRPQGTKNAGMGKELIKAKESSINRGMDRKEEGIKTSSTIRMAVDCAVAEYSKFQPITDSRTGFVAKLPSLEERIEHWRKYFVSVWDIEEPTSPVDINEPPF